MAHDQSSEQPCVEGEPKDGAMDGFKPATFQALYKVNAFNSVDL